MAKTVHAFTVGDPAYSSRGFATFDKAERWARREARKNGSACAIFCNRQVYARISRDAYDRVWTDLETHNAEIFA